MVAGRQWSQRDCLMGAHKKARQWEAALQLLSEVLRRSMSPDAIRLTILLK